MGLSVIIQLVRNYSSLFTGTFDKFHCTAFYDTHFEVHQIVACATCTTCQLGTFACCRIVHRVFMTRLAHQSVKSIFGNAHFSLLGHDVALAGLAIKLVSIDVLQVENSMAKFVLHNVVDVLLVRARPVGNTFHVFSIEVNLVAQQFKRCDAEMSHFLAKRLCNFLAGPQMNDCTAHLGTSSIGIGCIGCIGCIGVTVTQRLEATSKLGCPAVSYVGSI